MPIEAGFVLTTMKTESTARQVASGFLDHHRCSVEGVDNGEWTSHGTKRR